MGVPSQPPVKAARAEVTERVGGSSSSSEGDVTGFIERSTDAV